MNSIAETPSRHDRRRARTRSAILDAAERLFADEGFADTHVERIAETADVAIGSIYSHFGSKEGLWAALAARALELFDAYLQEAYRDEWTPLEQVCACGDAYLRFHAEHPGAFRFLAFDGTQLRVPSADGELAERISRRLAEVLGTFEAKIAEAMAAGEARPGDARLYARFLWAGWNATVALTVRDDELALTDDEVDRCLHQARALVMEGLSTPEFRGPDGLARGRLVRIEKPASA